MGDMRYKEALDSVPVYCRLSLLNSSLPSSLQTLLPAIPQTAQPPTWVLQTLQFLTTLSLTTIFEIMATGFLPVKNRPFVQFTLMENQEILKQSLISYIDWRCRTSENDQLPVDPSASSCSLHLCTHLDRTNQRVDKGTLSEFSNILENDGITRLDLLWNMKPYSKWFDATPGILISDAVA
ncbi:hypothetical protein NP233_g12302 [Leucocoprinus birnbaumii]|uniref:Uncharacterized protein n=1 Tax=Leucocoprinus birnbaumii TaxID=56174 RepID=A0AAD5VFC6_9AGAR|nr:hypothetical protein NP233_g12302 [Leucocoprinus birnbaumii]